MPQAPYSTLTDLSLPHLPSLKPCLKKQELAPSAYSSIHVSKDELHIAYTKDGKTTIQKQVLESNTESCVREETLNIVRQKHKLVATGFTGKRLLKKIGPVLWLEHDTVPFLVNKKEIKNGKTSVEEHLKLVSSCFDHNNIADIKILQNNEVQTTNLISLNHHRNTSFKEEFSNLLELSKKFQGHTISFINATPQGGGVALMRHALIRLFKPLKVNARWYILKPDPDVFNITKKKFHNILQAVSDPKMELLEEDKKLYNRWIKENAQIFDGIFKKSDILVIDDPQPSGLIPYIKSANPRAKVIYRSHIQIEAELANTQNTPQHKTWQFLWDNIKCADLFVSHPVDGFVPKDVPDNKVFFMPATTDPLDGLNKPLSKQQMSYYLKLFDKFLKDEGQGPLDKNRPYIIQIARFDPSKGIPDLLCSYLKLHKLCEEHGVPPPQLVIAGNGSVDDPDRETIFNTATKIANSREFAHLSKDIKIARLPHIDQLLNALLRKSKISLQLSTKEGFEIKVTEALMKGKPVIAYKTGGIPLQIRDAVNGFLVEPGDTGQVASHLFSLLTNEAKYREMSKAAQNLADTSLFTIPNAARWLTLSLKLLGKRSP